MDTTVQPKAIAHPTDAPLVHRALEMLVALVEREGVPLRQSHRRIAKRAAIMVGRNNHVYQLKHPIQPHLAFEARRQRQVNDAFIGEPLQMAKI